MWNYTCDKIFSKVLWSIIEVFGFLLMLSWAYSHYINGKGSYISLYEGKNFLQVVRQCWKYRENYFS